VTAATTANPVESSAKKINNPAGGAGPGVQILSITKPRWRLPQIELA
jgi:hypothetical protein